MMLRAASRGVAQFVLPIFLVISAPTTLRDAARSTGVLIGTAVRPGLFSEAAYSATLAREFNMVEPEDGMKWWTIRQNQGSFDFSKGDEVVRFAQAHGMKVRGHCLVWDHNNPDWLAQGHFRPEQLSLLLQEHITTVMRHYAGQVFAWDVVNEALTKMASPKILLGITSRVSVFLKKAQGISSSHSAGLAKPIPRRCFFTTRQKAKDSTANRTRSMQW